MQLNAEELKAARAKRSRLQKWIIYRKKEAIRKQQDLDEAEEVKRKMIMGGHIEFAVLPKTLKKGRDVELFARPRWFRAHPSLPKFSKIKVRVVPEVGSMWSGNCGGATLYWLTARPATGYSSRSRSATTRGSWPRRRRATSCSRSRRRWTLVIWMTASSACRRSSPAPAKRSPPRRNARSRTRSGVLAALAEKADVSDAELAALGDARFETPDASSRRAHGRVAVGGNLSAEMNQSQATGVNGRR